MTEVAERPQASAKLGVVTTLLLVVGPMLSMIDSAVVNVAIPDIARSLHTTLSQVQWTVSGYLLGLAVGQSVVAYLDRRLGTQRLYQLSLLLFGAASLACAAAPTIGVLIGCRVAQGLVAAPLVPISLSLLLGKAGSARQMPLSAGLMFFAAPAFGPVVGALLVSAFGWRSIFLINPPLVLIGLAGLRGIRHSRLGGLADRKASLDVIGVGLLAIALGLITFGASQGPRVGWLAVGTLPYLITGAVLLLGYAGWARRMASIGRPPALDLKLLRDARRSIGISIEALTSIVLYTVLVLAPVFLEQVQGRSVIATGLVLLPQGVMMGLASALGNVGVRNSDRYPWILPVSITSGLVLLTGFTLGLLFVNASTPAWMLAAILCGRGIAIGLTTQPLVFWLLGNLPAAEQADANTLFTVTQRLAGSVGVALLTSYFAIQTEKTHSPVTALHHVALVMSLAAAAGIAASLWLMLVNRSGYLGNNRRTSGEPTGA